LDLVYSDREIGRRVSRKILPTLPEKVVQAALDRMLSLQVYPKSVRIDDAYWQRTLKTRLDSGELKKPQATEYSVDNRFADAALKGERPQ
jgi:hypothetical protein